MKVAMGIVHEKQDAEPPVSESPGKRCVRSEKFTVACISLVMMTDVTLKTCITLTLPVIVAKLESVNESWFRNDESLPPFSAEHHNVDEMRDDVKQKVAWAVAVNPITESLMNLFAGFVVDCLGYGWPMVFGAVLGSVGSVGIAFSPTYGLLMLMRIITGTACSFSIVSCLAFISAKFPDNDERRAVIYSAYVASNVGNIVGNAVTGLMYEYLGTAAPFLCISGVFLVDTIIRFIAVSCDDPTTSARSEKKFSPEDYFQRLEDPPIVLLVVVGVLASFSTGFYKASIIEWELHTIHGQIWQLSIIYTACIVAQVFGTTLSSRTMSKCGHAPQLLLGFIGMALSYLTFLFCETVWACTGPELSRAFFCGLVFFAMPSLCSLLTETKHHKGKYGVVMGLFNSTLNVGVFIGALTSGLFASTIDIRGLIFIVAGLLVFSAFASVTFFKVEGDNATEVEENENEIS
ncbi:chromaffin granule amine transporter-like [Tubulanus polymorphus]|uniref:chromaffin granule amine transporter-like n=1 Tax=Tubulanus polymorphus TaxID=672921 RepID=UPI003DA574BB